MANAKVTLNGTTLIDLTGDTVTADAMLSGRTAHSSNGSTITGTIGTVVHANPSVSINTSTGVITATHSQSSGYVSNGTTTSSSLSLATVSGTTISPTESEQTAVASQPYTLGAVVVGAISSNYIGSNIPTRSATDLSASGSAILVPSGYYAADASKAVSTGSATTPETVIIADPTLSINSSTGIVTGVVSKIQNITPSVTPGYISSGTAGTVTVDGGNLLALSTQAGITISPTESEQTAVAAGKYTIGTVKVGAIPSKYKDTTNADAVASQVLTGKKFVNTTGLVTGSMPNNGAVSIALNTSTTSYTIPSGYHNGSGTVSLTTEIKSATPSANSQDIIPTTGKVLSKVTVAAIPANYGNTYGDTAYASGLLSGLTAHSYRNDIDAAYKITGTMPNNGAVSAVLSTSTTSYTVPTGYHNGSGTVSLTLETKSATPSTSSQSIKPTTGKVLSEVTVAAIPNNFKDTTGADAVASQVLSGKKFVNTTGLVTGTMTSNTATTTTLTASSTNYTIPSGYHTGSGKVQIITETKSATPSTASQDITPSTGKVLSKVTVAAIPTNYKDISGVTATAGDVVSGKTIVNSSGTVNGTIPVIDSMVKRTLDATTNNQVYEIQGAYYRLGGAIGISLSQETVSPTESQQVVTPSAGHVLSKVTVSAVSSNYIGSNIPTRSGSDFMLQLLQQVFLLVFLQHGSTHKPVVVQL